MRLHVIEGEVTELCKSDLFELWSRVGEAEALGRDLLEEMARGAEAQVKDAQCRLNRMKRKISS